MSNVNESIKSLILIYVKENYNQYLLDNNLKKIDDNKIRDVIIQIYSQRKDHLKEFLKHTLKKVMKEEYIGDLFVNNICMEIFSDDEMCINRLTIEIQNYQKNI